MRLKDIAHLRTGDKGNNCNICVIPFNEGHYEFLQKFLTAERVKEFYEEFHPQNVTRYDVPQLKAFNFYLTDTLAGGVTRSLNIDRHGKSIGMALAELELPYIN